MGHFPAGGGGGGGTGTIAEITSTGATVTITDPTGPITDLEVAAGSGVTTFATRAGAVVPLVGDYSAFYDPIGAATAAAGPVVYASKFLGYDATGATDQVTNFALALTSLGTGSDGFPNPGTIVWGSGNFKFASSTPNIGPHVLIKGQGIYSTAFNSYLVGTTVSIGNNSAFSCHGPAQSTGDFIQSTFGGGFVDLTIDGTNVSGGSTAYPVVGLDYGDTQEPFFWCRVQNFATLSAGLPVGGPMIGVWARNYQGWCEKAHGFLSLFNNDNAMVFDVTRSGGTGNANPVGTVRGNSGTRGSRSHEFCNFDIDLYEAAEQNGVMVYGGSSLSGSLLRITGNYEKCTSSTTSIFSATDVTPAGYPSAGSGSTIDCPQFVLAITQDDPYTRPNTPSWNTFDATSHFRSDIAVRVSNVANTNIDPAAAWLPTGTVQPASISATGSTFYIMGVPGPYAPIASPALTGVPTAPTGTTGDNSTQLATDRFVTTAISNAIAGVNPAVILPTSYLAETIPVPNLTSSIVVAAGTGVLRMAAIWLPAGAVISNLIFITGTTPGATMTNWWLGLYDLNRVQLATTADQGATALAANAVFTQAIAQIAAGASATFTTTYAGIHYIGLMVKATTLPTLLGIATPAPGTGLRPGGAAANSVFAGTSDTVQTTPPAFPHTAGAMTASVGYPYMAIS